MINHHRILVIRRVGGLEVQGCESVAPPSVIRRVGGLEDCDVCGGDGFFVIRRVGGLEVTVGAFLRLPLT